MSSLRAEAQTLYERPVLIVDPGMHTATALGTAIDGMGHFLATGSNDKTVRIWSTSDGTLLRTIRMPAGPDRVGQIFAVAMSPDGNIVAAGGWSEGPGVAIYLLDRNTGKMTRRIGGLPNVVGELVFSADGRYLAAVCGSGGLRVFDRDKNWSEAFRDPTYGDRSYGAAFADDGRLATSSLDGKVRLYDPGFELVATQEALSGRHPMQLRFRPDGKVLAIGNEDKPSVDLLDGYSLARLPGPNVDGLEGGALQSVAWSADGQTLYASGSYRDPTGNRQVLLTWDQAGLGTRRAISAKCAENDDTTTALVSLPAGWLLVAKFNPCFTMLKADGAILWAHRPPGGDFRHQRKTFSVSADGTVIDFGFEPFGKSPLRFDVRALKLSNERPADDRTRPPSQGGLQIEDWILSNHPRLDGKPIELDALERSLSLAIHPDVHRFILGADWSLRAFSAEGKELWRRMARAPVWAVNITGDGRLVVAAYGDGTIRWHRMDDGRELLALQVLNDKKNWVAWTPDGFYDATSGAFGVLKWHKNGGSDSAGDATPVYEIPKLKRPDVLPLVLQELEIVRALGIAELAAPRRGSGCHRGCCGPWRTIAYSRHRHQRLWRQGRKPTIEIRREGRQRRGRRPFWDSRR